MVCGPPLLTMHTAAPNTHQCNPNGPPTPSNAPQWSPHKRNHVPHQCCQRITAPTHPSQRLNVLRCSSLNAHPRKQCQPRVQWRPGRHACFTAKLCRQKADAKIILRRNVYNNDEYQGRHVALRKLYLYPYALAIILAGALQMISKITAAI